MDRSETVATLSLRQHGTQKFGSSSGFVTTERDGYVGRAGQSSDFGSHTFAMKPAQSFSRHDVDSIADFARSDVLALLLAADQCWSLFRAPELTDYLFDDDTEYELAVSNAYAIADGVAKMSAEFRGVTFAYVDADCFGGTCLYSGFTTVDGNVISRVEPDRKGHKKLLREVGLRIWNHFAPFTRNYFSDG